MTDISFVGDGQATFEKVIIAIPEPMRESMEPRLRQMLQAKAGDSHVDGELVKTWVEEDLPEPQKGLLMAALGMETEEAPESEPEMESAGIEWEGAAEAMFERMLEEVPDALRNAFRGKLLEVAREKAAGGPVLEDHIKEIVNEKVPDPFKTNILKAYATMGGVNLARVEVILEEKWRNRDTILSILHGIQEEFGYCPPEALVLVSQKTSVPIADLYRMVSTYQAFRTEAPKKHNITVCTCSGCYVKGAGKIISGLRERIAKEDADVDLQTVRGLGCCNISPAVLVDGSVYSFELAKEKIEEVFGV